VAGVATVPVGEESSHVVRGDTKFKIFVVVMFVILALCRQTNTDQCCELAIIGYLIALKGLR